MKEKWFDKKLVERLQDKSSEADFEAMWSSIEDKRKPKPSYTKAYTLLGILALLMAGFYFYNSSSISSLAVADESQIPAQSTTLNQQKTTNKNSSKKNELTNDQLENNQQRTVMARSGNEHPEKSTEASKSTSKKVKKSTSSTAQSKQKAQSLAKLNARQNIGQTTSIIDQPATSDQKHLGLNKISDQHLQPQKSLSNLGKNRVWSNNDLTKTSIVKDSSRRNKVQAMAILPMYSMGISKEQNSLSTLKLLSNGHFIQKKVADKRALRMLGLQTQYGLADRRIIFPRDVAEHPYLESQSSLDQLSINGFFSYYFHPYWYAKIGMGFEQYTFRDESQGEVLSNATVSDTTEIIKFSENDIQYIIGDVNQQTREQYDHINYLKHRTIKIPLRIGTTFKLSDTWFWNLETGVNISMANLSKGKTYRNGFVSLAEQAYNNVGLVSGVLGAELRRSIGNKYFASFGIDGMMDLNYRNNTTIVLSNPDPIPKDKFHSLNLSLGFYRKI